MVEVKQVRQKASLAEQGSSLGNKAKKEGACPVEAHGKSTEMLLATVRIEFVWPKLS